MKVTDEEFTKAMRECAEAGADPTKSWSQLPEQAKAALIKHIAIITIGAQERAGVIERELAKDSITVTE